MDLRQLEISMKVAQHMNDSIRALPVLKDNEPRAVVIALMAAEIIGAASILPAEVRCDVMRIATDSIILHEQEMKRFKEEGK